MLHSEICVVEATWTGGLQPASQPVAMVNATFMLTIRICASLSSTAMILSPSPAMYRIYQTKSVGHTSIIALVSVLANCHMWMLYGILYHRFFPVVTTFALGDAIALFFLAVYYRYTTERRYVLKVVGVTVGALLVMTIYTVLGANNVTRQSRTQVEYIVGAFGILASMFLYGAGFEKIVQVLKFKTAIFIPIDMVVAGTINQAFWLTYLRLDRNWLMLASSIMCTVLSVSQLILYVIYNPNRRKPTMPGAAAGASREIDISIVVSDLAPKDPYQLLPVNQQQVPLSPVYQLALTPREG
ncbi:hypothetical protein Gpo141_00014867, partial [Globisporangium polare]